MKIFIKFFAKNIQMGDSQNNIVANFVDIAGFMG